MASCSQPVGPRAGISFCAGYAGLDLGLHISEPLYRTVCFVERQSHAAAALVARMEDKSLDQAPVWDDLTTFDSGAWRGKVDCILAGYPCQPFSSAGHRKAEDDPRHLWPYIQKHVETIRPAWLFFENVEGHLDRGFYQVARDIQDLGYRVEAGLFSAYEVGGAHWRRRLFILAYTDIFEFRNDVRNSALRERDCLLSEYKGEGEPDPYQGSIIELDTPLDVSSCHGLETGKEDDGIPLFAPPPADYYAWRSLLKSRPDLQPHVFRTSHGLADRLERCAGAGNGVVPLAAAYAWRTLKAQMMEKMETI